MSRHAEDKDHTEFFGLEQPDGEPLVVSRAGFMLHTAAIVNSVNDGTPGFISDDYLNAISAETTITALELCTLGMWERIAGGYRILDDEMIQVVIRQNQRMDAEQRECIDNGAHVPTPEDERFCERCATAIGGPNDPLPGPDDDV